MACRPFNLGGGVSGFMCGPRGKQRSCSAPGCSSSATKQCDAPVTRRAPKAGDPPPGQAPLPGVPVLTVKGTCDAYLCARHATKIGPELDLCPAHARQRALQP